MCSVTQRGAGNRRRSVLDQRMPAQGHEDIPPSGRVRCAGAEPLRLSVSGHLKGASDGRKDQEGSSAALHPAGGIAEEHLSQPQPVQAMVLQVAEEISCAWNGVA